ncbi:MAG TPA: hydroxymethylglutaryl-CoA lyase [bacterium]|nr:hydroxymethylglutaryl-CoA lyase [bacterium]
MSRRVPPRVRVFEVGPRDGLQNETAVLALDDKVEFVRRLAACGLPQIEAGAFVREDRVPQMAGTDALVRRLTRGDTGRPAMAAGDRPVLSALVPNRRGMERALAAGVREVAVFTAASDAFARHNINMTVAESLARFRDVVAMARGAAMRARAYVSTAWWCPYSGRVPPAAARRVASALAEMGCYEIALSDTIGAATPGEVAALVEQVAGDISIARVAVHLHDTRGTALANVLAALEAGVTTVDAAAGGLGGCPYAPGASGNLATEDLLYMLRGMGVETGVDLDAVAAASRWLAGRIGRSLPSRYLAAGPVVPEGGPAAEAGRAADAKS